MKLWQKIFLLTLLLTIMAVNTVSLVLLTSNQNNSLSLAKENAQMACHSVVADLEQGIQNEKDMLGRSIFPENELISFLSSMAADLSSEQCDILVSPISVGYSSFDCLSQDERTYNTKLIDQEEGQYGIQVSTTAFWEGHFFRITTLYDVSDLFAQFHKDILFSQWFCGIVALVVAVALLVTILIVTQPLKQLEAASKEIASGDYRKRIRVKGHDEISELSEQMNIMSAEIEAKINRIEEISTSREIFIANMTHELKTPLTSILGFADLLKIKSEVSEDERREYASIIAAEAKRLRLLSAKLMELVSMEETTLQLSPTPLKELIEQAIEAFMPISEEYHCPIRSELATVEIQADVSLFTSLILNLLDNARKASAPGQTIDVSLKSKDEKAIIRIQDHGVGIPQEHLSRVTEAFYMVNKARSRGAGGAGLGLSLCKAITEAHHGTFEINSRENYGTIVILTFPVAGGVV